MDPATQHARRLTDDADFRELRRDVQRIEVDYAELRRNGADVARELRDLRHAQQQQSWELYGYPDRKDDLGRFGRIDEQLAASRRLMLTMLATSAGALLTAVVDLAMRLLPR